MKLKNGAVEVTSNDFPLFLYENEEYHENDPYLGLCRGPFLVKVGWLFFIATWIIIIILGNVRNLFRFRIGEEWEARNAPASWRKIQYQDHHPTHDSIHSDTSKRCFQINLYFVNCYRFIQARFALSSTTSWGTDNGLFLFNDFYYAVLELFEYPGDPWVKDTLQFWNQYVYLMDRRDAYFL